MRRMAPFIFVPICGAVLYLYFVKEQSEKSFSVRIYSEPDGAAVSLNGRFAGRTPTTVSVEKSRRYTLSLVKDGYRVCKRELLFSPESTRLHITLKPIKYATLVIRSKPPGARVYLDGAEVGTTPLTLEKIADGGHELRLVKEPFEPLVKQLSIGREERLELDLELTSSVERQLVESIQREPFRVENYIELLKVLRTKQDYANAVAYILNMLEAILNNPPSAECLDEFLPLFKSIYSSGKSALSEAERRSLLQKVSSTFEKLLEKDISRSDLYTLLLDLYLLAGDPDSILPLCEKAYKNGLGISMYLNASNKSFEHHYSSIGLKCLEEAYRLSPTSVYVKLRLGYAYYRAGRYEKAEEVLLALKGKGVPEDYASMLRSYLSSLAYRYLRLGDRLARKGRTSKAMEKWKKALKLQPDREEAGEWASERASKLRRRGYASYASQLLQLAPPVKSGD